MRTEQLMNLVLDISDKYVKYRIDGAASTTQYDVLHSALWLAVKDVKNPPMVAELVVDNLLKEIFVYTSKAYKKAYEESKNQTQQQKDTKKNPIGFNSDL